MCTDRRNDTSIREENGTDDTTGFLEIYLWTKGMCYRENCVPTNYLHAEVPIHLLQLEAEPLKGMKVK